MSGSSARWSCGLCAGGEALDKGRSALYITVFRICWAEGNSGHHRTEDIVMRTSSSIGTLWLRYCSDGVFYLLLYLLRTIVFYLKTPHWLADHLVSVD